METASAKPTSDAATETERTVMAVWLEVFRLPSVSRHDDLLDLGVDSLAAMDMCLRLGQLFRIEISPAKLIVAPTIAKLATLIDESRRN